LLTWLLLLPTEAVSRPRVAVDELRTVEVSNPRGPIPLAPSEIIKVKQIADASDQVKRARASAADRPRPPGLEQLAAVQTLFTQRHIEDKNADPLSRKADVLYYNYSTNEVIRVVVDLKSNAALETDVAGGAPNTQPFFTSAETKAALQLIFDHPQLGPRLRTAYREVTGQDLVNISQLEAQGGIFFPVARAPLGAVTADCAQDRCMQLFIPIDDTSFIDTSNLVVDLTTGQILWVDQGLAGHTH
jgi:hypothetical protein